MWSAIFLLCIWLLSLSVIFLPQFLLSLPFRVSYQSQVCSLNYHLNFEQSRSRLSSSTPLTSDAYFLHSFLTFLQKCSFSCFLFFVFCFLFLLSLPNFFSFFSLILNQHYFSQFLYTVFYLLHLHWTLINFICLHKLSIYLTFLHFCPTIRLSFIRTYFFYYLAQ